MPTQQMIQHTAAVFLGVYFGVYAILVARALVSDLTTAPVRLSLRTLYFGAWRTRLTAACVSSAVYMLWCW